MNANGHLTADDKAAYWLRTLPPSALPAISEHLQECARCREELIDARPPNVSVSDPKYEELVGWLEEKLDPIERHELSRRLQDSPQAAAELADLLKFRREMNQLPERVYLPGDAFPRSRSSWILPIAAGLALGCGFLWLISVQQNRRAIALRDGGEEIVVRQDGGIPALGHLPPELTRAISKTVSSGKVELSPELSMIRNSDSTLAGANSSGQTLAVISPVGTLVEAVPTFRWRPDPSANGYRVNLVAKNNGQLLSSPMLGGRTTTWRPNEGLRPGQEYEWEVEALHDGEMIAKAPAPPAAEARFAVLPNENRMAIDKLRAQFGHSHLVMGIVYALAGLLDQARDELELLAQENPTSDLPKKLIASLTNRTH